jgi:hypothetical protein
MSAGTPSAADVERILAKFSQKLLAGSYWHPVPTAWLRQLRLHFHLDNPLVGETRDPPGPLDNSSIVDTENPECLRRGTVSATRVPAGSTVEIQHL